MSEENKEGQKEVDFYAPDYLLQHLVSIANSSGMSFGVTVWVGGDAVSGQLIGGKEYFDLLKEAMLAGTSNVEGAQEAFGEMFDGYSAIYTDPTEKVQPPAYIHLKNAKIYSPGHPPMPSSGLLWRGRVTNVCGFSLGSFSVS